MLPQVGPGATAALVLAAQAPNLAALWRKPAPAAFCDAVVQVRRWPPVCQCLGVGVCILAVRMPDPLPCLLTDAADLQGNN